MDIEKGGLIMRIVHTTRIYLTSGNSIDIVDTGDFVQLSFNGDVYIGPANCLITRGYSLQRIVAELHKILYSFSYDEQSIPLGFTNMLVSPLKGKWAGIISVTKEECQEIYTTLSLLATKYKSD